MATPHLDRVLMTLAAVLMVEAEAADPVDTRPKEKAVAPLTEKASADLATIRSLERASQAGNTQARSGSEPTIVQSSINGDATSRRIAPPGPLPKSNEIVVAPHPDRILMSLSAVLMDDSGADGRFGAQPKETVVATQSEKVLANLSTIRSLDRDAKAVKSRAKAAPRARASAPTTAPAARDTIVRETSLTVAPTVLDIEIETVAGGEPRSDPPRAIDAAATDATRPETAEAANSPVAAAPSQADRTAGGSQGSVPLPVSGSQTKPIRSPLGDGWQAMAAVKLDEVRGGFITDTGLKISFGIERAVYINGSLVTTTSLNVADLGKISAGRGANSSGLDASSLALIQNGKGNTFATGQVSMSGLGTVIQNTLNDQKIQNVTVINATVNSMQILRSVNLQTAVRGALTDSLRR